MNYIDIPELQLIAVVTTGFFVGGFFLEYWKQYPMVFTLFSTLIFFGVRFVPEFFELDKSAPNSIPGNGILSGAIMFTIYVAMMHLGAVVIHRKYGKIGD